MVSMASCYLFVTINVLAFSFAPDNTKYCSRGSVVYNFVFFLSCTHDYRKKLYISIWEAEIFIQYESKEM